MSAKSTWSLLLIAAIIFAFIFFIEHPHRQARLRPPETRILPNLQISNITSVQLQSSGEVDLRIERTNSTWQLKRPLVYSADRFKVESFLQKLGQITWQGHITAAELQDRPNAGEEFGFDNPAVSIAIHEGNNRRHLLIGKKVAVADQVFAQVVGADGIYVIDSDLLNLVPKNVDEWRDHGLANWSEVAFDTLKTKAGNNSLELQFNPKNFMWRMTRPLEARADNQKINELLQKISTLKIAQFVSDEPTVDLDKYGLQPPELEISFARGTNDLFVLQVGSSPTNNPSLAFARRKNQNHIFLVPRDAVAAWRLPYSDFRERHLANLPENAIDHIEIKGEDSFVLSKQTNGVWTIPGQPFTADSVLVQELIARLNSTEIEVEKNVVTDFSTYGLKVPLLHYTLKMLNDNPTNQPRADRVTEIDFGTNNGAIFAHRSDESSVYTVKLEDFQFFPRASWQMRDRQVWSFDSKDVVNVVIEQKGQTRQLIRNAKGDWIIAPGSQGIIVNTFSFEEAIHRLGDLKAVFWTARGDANLAKYGFKEMAHQISLQVKRNGKIETLDLEFGGLSEFQHPYAAVTIGGEKLIFEFPWPLYYDFVLRDLSIQPSSLPNAR